MKITFFSNYLSHHQLPFSKCMFEHTEIDYCFVSTIPMVDERLKGGWRQEAVMPFELRTYECFENEKRAKDNRQGIQRRTSQCQ